MVAKKFTGQLTVVEPFSFEKVKEAAVSKSDVILDVEITVPPSRVANLKIRKGDSVKRTV